jgi:hypothetical protein
MSARICPRLVFQVLVTVITVLVIPPVAGVRAAAIDVPGQCAARYRPARMPSVSQRFKFR